MTTMQIDRAVVEQALEAWQTATYGHPSHHKATLLAMTALRAALAQQDEPVEPVAWQCREHGDSEWFDCGKESYGINPRRYTYRTLYTAPPPPRRLPLTEEEIESCRQKGYAHAGLGAPFDFDKAARAVEKASWEKNHGQA